MHELENGNCDKALQLQEAYCSLGDAVLDSQLNRSFHIEAQAEYNGKLGVLPIPLLCEVDIVRVLSRELTLCFLDNTFGLFLYESDNISCLHESLCCIYVSSPITLYDVFLDTFVVEHDRSLNVTSEVRGGEHLPFSCSFVTIFAYTGSFYLQFLDCSYNSLWFAWQFKSFVGRA